MQCKVYPDVQIGLATPLASLSAQTRHNTISELGKPKSENKFLSISQHEAFKESM